MLADADDVEPAFVGDLGDLYHLTHPLARRDLPSRARVRGDIGHRWLGRQYFLLFSPITLGVDGWSLDGGEGPVAPAALDRPEAICRSYLDLRYRLMPYTYTLAREAHDTGLPLMRPLALNYPTNPEALDRASEFLGEDLEAVASRHGLTADAVIRHHSAGDYRVYMLGFTPGFAYLGGLDPRIATPRRNEPRLFTPSGTISIGGVQAAIQCLAAPSGWHLLGRTPVRVYHPGREPMFLMAPGDRVSFYSVPASQWDALDRAAEAGDPVAERSVS